ncbi:MAG: endonuclease, partial [Bacteroidota bacterium]
MKRVLTTFLGLALMLPALAQVPSGYYTSAEGLSGNALKAALNDIISGHTEFPYSASTTDTWDILKETDRDPNNPNNVIGIYSGFSMDGPAEYNSGNGWNREHTWAKSRGDFGTTLGAGTDVHHLRAADISTNSARNNRNFGEATTPYVDGSGQYSGATGSFTSSSEYVWEPRAEVKGDIARMIFYMATRYEGENGEVDLELTETLLSNTDKSPLHARLSVLLAWHVEDPVDQQERDRNDVIYSYQNNRNPFIDRPEFVEAIWGAAPSPQLTFTSSPVTTATEDQAYTYSITTANADGTVSITATTKPAWLTLSDNGNGTATLSGTPVTGDVGSSAVTLSAADNTNTASQTFTLVVNGTGGGGNPGGGNGGSSAGQ